MKKLIFTMLLCIVFLQMPRAQQLDINADVRFRYEYRNGYGTLRNDTMKAANFINQRTRLKLEFKSDHIKVHISPQNIRTWGDVPTTAQTDINFQLHETWAEISPNSKWDFKLGRQELNYDDARILGNVDWSMQARSHDLALVKFHPNTKHQLHIGGAYNTNKATNIFEDYQVKNQYKTMQMAWYHGTFEKWQISGLFMNQGIPYEDQDPKKEKLAWNQTTGFRLTSKLDKIDIAAASYIQTGKIASTLYLANYAAASIYYRQKKWNSGVGFERLSGQDFQSTKNRLTGFQPWFGTNHKFNGFMDYFFVGNHANNVGLTDVYVDVNFTHKNFKLRCMPHYFASAAPVYDKLGDKMSSTLGGELDLDFSYKPYPYLQISAGYSQLYSTNSLMEVKGGTEKMLNHWGYIGITIQPGFSFNKKEG